ncbi:MAG: hypothetical protein EOP85_18200 [Verrucomicrobiaceae bacterium]|nr:MAG: hypothetical protein EOP85_18200 [Verrucomicrobiaceae bacterium]
MKSPLLPVATLVVGVAAGLLLDKEVVVKRGSMKADAVANFPTRHNSGERERSTEDAVLADFIGGRTPGELDAEEVYRLLLPWNQRVAFDRTFGNTQEDVRRDYRLRLLLRKIPLPVLGQTLDLARRGDVSFSTSHEIFAILAARDWDNAMAWAADQRDTKDLKSAALDLMAETNPDLARVIYEDWLNDGTAGRSGSVATTIARHEAGRGHAALLEFLEGLPSITERPSISQLMRELPDEVVPDFLKEFQRRGMEDTTAYPVDRLMLETEDTHPKEFHRWIESLEPEKRSRLSIHRWNSLG